MIIENKTGTILLAKKVTATTTAAQVSATSVKSRYGFDFKAPAGNSGTVYLGGCDVNATDSYPLAAGESVHIDIEDLANVYMLASATTQDLKYVGVA